MVCRLGEINSQMGDVKISWRSVSLRAEIIATVNGKVKMDVQDEVSV